MARVLIIDDDMHVRRACQRVLEVDAHEVHTAVDGAVGLATLEGQSFDVVIADVQMPGIGGIELVRVLKKVAPGVPVIVITGNPSVDSASEAVEVGAWRYLPKPIDPVKLRDAVRRLSARSLDEVRPTGRPSLDDLHDRVDAALSQAWLAVQPMVDLRARRVAAYEALLRTHEESLRRPDEFVRTAQRLGRLTDVGATVRRLATARIEQLPDNVLLFVNVHPLELYDEGMFTADGLGLHAARVVLEITERASLSSIPNLRHRVDRLRTLGYRIAIDDLGEGYAGLSNVAALEPDVLKLDMSLVRGVDGNTFKRSVVDAMVAMCSSLGRTLIAEGVETPAERDVLARAGITWMQGYLFARPSEQFVTVEL